MFAKKRVMVFVAAACAAISQVAFAQATGPSSSESPYVVPVAPGWSVTSLLTAGDSVNLKTDGMTPYRMVGIPDGLGAYDAGKGMVAVVMNHELRDTNGIPRDHGSAGAFVSQWLIEKDTLKVHHGGDLIKQVYLWDHATSSYTTATTAFNRLCSADLPAITAFYNPKTGKGFNGRIFMNGEESGNEGRAFAHIVSGADAGASFELPYLGRFSWENSVAHPDTGDKTVVVGLDDSSPGQIYVHYGDKKTEGNEVQKAGLTGGTLYGIKTAVAKEAADAATPISGMFSLHAFGDVSGLTGAKLQEDSVAAGVTEFARPEDGAWDPTDRNVFYFVTTASFSGNSRLYRLRFKDVLDPAAGGGIEEVINGTAIGAHMFDNLTVSADGKVYIQEDPGNQPYLARIWEVNPKAKTAKAIFESDPARFAAGSAAFLTQDEENSGIIDVTRLFRDARWYKRGTRVLLGTNQAHYGIAGELVEGGQLYLMTSPRGKLENAADLHDWFDGDKDRD